MAMSSLEFPCPRDVALKEYGEWQMSNVENDALKSAFRQVCDVMLDNGLDLGAGVQGPRPKILHRDRDKIRHRSTFRRGHRKVG